jgi:hypothetical protein
MSYGFTIGIVDDASKTVKTIGSHIKETDTIVGKVNRNLKTTPGILDQGAAAAKRGSAAQKSWLRQLISFNSLVTKATGLMGAAFGVQQIVAFGAEAIKLEQDVATAFGVTGQELESVTAQVSKVSTVFGVEADELVKVSKSFNDNFSLDVGSSIDLLQTALSKGVPDTFMSDVESLAPAFAEAGFTAEETISLLVRSEEHTSELQSR